MLFAKTFAGAALAAPSNGYWVNTKSLDAFSGDGLDLYHCPRSTCKGSSPEKSPSCWSPKNTTECDPDELLCTTGAAGPLCSSCIDGFVYSLTTRQCAECGKFDVLSVSIMGAVLVLGAFAAAVTYFHLFKFPACIRQSWLFGILGQIDSGMVRVVWGTLQIVQSAA